MTYRKNNEPDITYTSTKWFAIGMGHLRAILGAPFKPFIWLWKSLRGRSFEITMGSLLAFALFVVVVAIKDSNRKTRCTAQCIHIHNIDKYKCSGWIYGIRDISREERYIDCTKGMNDEELCRRWVYNKEEQS